jgi:hypothetical protein
MALTAITAFAQVSVLVEVVQTGTEEERPMGTISLLEWISLWNTRTVTALASAEDSCATIPPPL